jgi:hypothetical protein
MRAWIEDAADDDDHGVITGRQNALVCEYINGDHSYKYAEIPMKPKPYYIEYPEEDMTESVAAPVQVRIDITGLTNKQIIDLLNALNAAGFEGVFIANEPVYKPIPVYPTYPQPRILPNPLSPYISNLNTDLIG